MRASGKPRRYAVRQAASRSVERRACPRSDMDQPLLPLPVRGTAFRYLGKDAARYRMRPRPSADEPKGTGFASVPNDLEIARVNTGRSGYGKPGSYTRRGTAYWAKKL